MGNPILASTDYLFSLARVALCHPQPSRMRTPEALKRLVGGPDAEEGPSAGPAPALPSTALGFEGWR